MKRRAALAFVLVGATLMACEAKVEVKSPPPPPPPPPPAPPPHLESITVSNRIEFETDSAVLLPQSFPIIDEVVKVLNEHPHVTKVEVHGHTDDTGDKNKNLLLSENRAKSVMVYIISKGIKADRLAARGFGATVPVAGNDTPEGREKNRRVEFRIVEQGTTTP